MTLEDIISSLNERTDLQLSVEVFHGSSHGLYRSVLNASSGKRFFLKYSLSDNSVSMDQLKKEAMALSIFRDLHIRNPLYYFSEDIPAILLEYIANNNDNSDIAWQVAQLHSSTAETFGFHYPAYIASIPVLNHRCENWAEFYWFYRVQPLIEVCIKQNLLPSGMLKCENRFVKAIHSIVPEDKPRLIHGDLWAGNYLVDQSGLAYLIDPAIFYGHREMDIAMSKLFGGFPANFYEEYNSIFPIQAGWENRLKIFQFYYLLVHVLLFGKSYATRTKRYWDFILR